MGCGNFPCLIIKAFLWPSTITRKRRTDEKAGGGSLIHQGIRMKAWPPELPWNGREFVSHPKQEYDCPSQEGWRLWNWKPSNSSCSHLHGMGMSCPRRCGKHGSPVLGEGGWGLLWVPAPTTGISRWVMVTGGRKRSTNHHGVCLPGADQGNRAACLFYQPGRTARHWRGTSDLQLTFPLNNYNKPFQNAPFLHSPHEVGWGCRGSATHHWSMSW